MATPPRAQYVDIAGYTDANGFFKPVTTTRVTVYLAVPYAGSAYTTLATLRSAETGSGTPGNPFDATTGEINFWAAPGSYDIKIEDLGAPSKFATKYIRWESIPGDKGLAATMITDSAVVGAAIATDAVTATDILDGTVGTSELATDAVTTAKILDSNVTTAKILNSNVTLAKLATDAKLNQYGTKAARLAAGQVNNRTWYETDTGDTYLDNGTTWLFVSATAACKITTAGSSVSPGYGVAPATANLGASFDSNYTTISSFYTRQAYTGSNSSAGHSIRPLIAGLYVVEGVFTMSAGQTIGVVGSAAGFMRYDTALTPLATSMMIRFAALEDIWLCNLFRSWRCTADVFENNHIRATLW